MEQETIEVPTEGVAREYVTENEDKALLKRHPLGDIYFLNNDGEFEIRTDEMGGVYKATPKGDNHVLGGDVEVIDASDVPAVTEE